MTLFGEWRVGKKITSATSEVLNMESSVKILQYLICNTRYIFKKNAEPSETFLLKMMKLVKALSMKLCKFE